MSVTNPDLARSFNCNPSLSPEVLGTLLMDSATERAGQALDALRRDDRNEAIHLSRVLTALISSLQSNLDPLRDGPIADNLDALYDYMIIRLSGAGEAGNEAAFSEVQALLGQIRQGWASFQNSSGH